jgi:hypothetical protein
MDRVRTETLQMTRSGFLRPDSVPSAHANGAHRAVPHAFAAPDARFQIHLGEGKMVLGKRADRTNRNGRARMVLRAAARVDRKRLFAGRFAWPLHDMGAFLKEAVQLMFLDSDRNLSE